MNFYVLRGSEQYGPYNRETLQSHITTGLIFQTDLCRDESSTKWLPVADISQFLVDKHAVSSIPQPQQVAAAAISHPTPWDSQGAIVSGNQTSAIYAPAVPPPPNLHWAILLGLSILTLGLFWFIWCFVQASWVRKSTGNSNPLILYGVAAAIGFFSGIVRFDSAFAIIGMWVCWIFALFSMRISILKQFNVDYPTGLKISKWIAVFLVVATTVLGTVYLQFHINRIARWRKTGYLG